MSSTQIDTLEALLHQAGGPPLPEIKIALSRLSLELRDRAQKGSSSSYEFFVSAVEALARIKGVALADLRFECLYESVAFFYRSGFGRQALQASEVLSKLAQAVGHKTWLTRAATTGGVIHAEAGNIAEAITQHAIALRIARESSDQLEEVKVLLNLGTAFLYGSLHEECVRCFQRVVVLSSAAHLVEYQAAAYCNLAQSYLAQEQFQLGFDCITRSLELTPEPASARDAFKRTIREFTYVEIALELGKLARAREHAAQCSRYSKWGDNPRCRSMAEIGLGLCEVHGGDVEKGLATLHRALDQCGDFAISRIDVLTALVKAYEVVDRPERALHYFNEYMSFVRTARADSLDTVLFGDTQQRVHSSASDVRALELREAKLIAKVAQHEVLNSRLELLERLAITADLREEASGQHGFRVGRLSRLLAQSIGKTDDFLRAIEIGGRLHDIGKSGLPDRILHSCGNLRESERKFITAHTVIGSELLGKSAIPMVQLAEEIARHHHEWWDGTGYPAKLSGKRIPLHARIVALADVFDALTHGRPYAPAWSIDRAIEEVQSKRGTQFDPELTDAFLALIGQLRGQHSDLDAYLAEAGRNSAFLQARERIRLMLEGGRSTEDVAAAPAETVH